MALDFGIEEISRTIKLLQNFILAKKTENALLTYNHHVLTAMNQIARAFNGAALR